MKDTTIPSTAKAATIKKNGLYAPGMCARAPCMAGSQLQYAADRRSNTIGGEDQSVVLGIVFHSKVACGSCRRYGQPAA